MLKDATDKFVSALATAGGVPGLSFLSDSLEYIENNKAATSSFKTGVLSQAFKVDHSRSSLDTTQCATFTEVISADSKKPYVFATVMRFTGEKVTKIETIITTTGDWLFNAANTLKYATQEDSKWTVIPEDKRDTRAVIQHAGDAYCDLFNNKSVVVPWGTPCNRLEGGSYIGSGSPTDSCNVGVPSGVSLKDRRYVIDEAMGTVDIMMTFGTLPDSHEFRVENGKLRFVHTMSVQKKSTLVSARHYF